MQAEQLESKPYFDKETTLIIKGIALIMMFVHHFFTFPDWWVEGVNYYLVAQVAPIFCKPFQTCVPVFCFLTGYLYFHNKEKNYSYSFRKITDILLEYWGVFFLFAILAVMTVHYVYTPAGFVKEMFALDLPTMTFCWYVYFYCILMLILPLFSKLLSKNIHLDLFFSILFLPEALTLIYRAFFMSSSNVILIRVLNSVMSWLPIALLGFIFARYGLFERMADHFKKIPSMVAVFVWLLGAICAPMGRFLLPNFTLNSADVPFIHKILYLTISMDVIYVPIFIFCIINLCRTISLKYVEFLLKQIGKYSLYMWFVSCIFYGNAKSVFQPILYWPHNPILVLVWGLLFCYFVSVILDFGLRFIIKQKNKLFFRGVKNVN